MSLILWCLQCFHVCWKERGTNREGEEYNTAVSDSPQCETRWLTSRACVRTQWGHLALIMMYQPCTFFLGWICAVFSLWGFSRPIPLILPLNFCWNLAKSNEIYWVGFHECKHDLIFTFYINTAIVLCAKILFFSLVYSWATLLLQALATWRNSSTFWKIHIFAFCILKIVYAWNYLLQIWEEEDAGIGLGTDINRYPGLRIRVGSRWQRKIWISAPVFITNIFFRWAFIYTSPGIWSWSCCKVMSPLFTRSVLEWLLRKISTSQHILCSTMFTT